MNPRTFFALVEEVQQVSSVEEIHAFCSRLCTQVGFSHFLFGTRVSTSFTQPQSVIISGYPSAWWDHYKRFGFMQQDPILTYSILNNLPRDWHSITQHLENPLNEAVMNQARDFGMKSGLACPVHGAGGAFALLSFASNLEHASIRAETEEHLAHIHLLSSHIHEALLRTVEIREFSIQTSLTTREQECLLWSAEGKTAWETGQILNISERTVTFHLQNVCHKLNVTNRQQAVARAISLGLITPQFR